MSFWAGFHRFFWEVEKVTKKKGSLKCFSPLFFGVSFLVDEFSVFFPVTRDMSLTLNGRKNRAPLMGV